MQLLLLVKNLIFKKYNNLKTVRSAPECEAFVISYAHLFETGWSAPQGGHCPSLKQSVALSNATNGEPIFLTTVWSLLECYKQTPKTIRSAPECHKCIKTVRNVSQNQFFEESRDIHPLAFKKWTLNTQQITKNASVAYLFYRIWSKLIKPATLEYIGKLAQAVWKMVRLNPFLGLSNRKNEEKSNHMM